MDNAVLAEAVLRNLPSPVELRRRMLVRDALSAGRIPEDWTIFDWFAYSLQDAFRADGNWARVLNQVLYWGSRVNRQGNEFSLAFSKDIPDLPVFTKRINDCLASARWKIASTGEGPRHLYFHFVPLSA